MFAFGKEDKPALEHFLDDAQGSLSSWLAVRRAQFQPGQ